MAQDIEITYTTTEVVKADINVPEGAQIRSIKVSGQEFHARPGLDWKQLSQFLQQAGIQSFDDFKEMKVADIAALAGFVLPRILRLLSITL